MGTLDGRVAIVTGAGRGIGREHALLFAAEGAKVVVNDLGGAIDGSGADQGPAADVVDEITAAGGEAVANTDDVASWDGAHRLVAAAVEHFGDLHVLVNNAGILRNRMLVNMAEAEWDAIMHVHLKGHFCPTCAAAADRREQVKAGRTVRASVVNTSSTSGLFGNAGQSNYGAAKSGIASFTMICQTELSRYGVRCNAIAPVARTRLTLQTPGTGERMATAAEEAAAAGRFDELDPANVSPFVAYLATEDCPIGGRVFLVQGGVVSLFQPWAIVDTISTDHRWSVEELQTEAGRFADYRFDLRNPFER